MSTRRISVGRLGENIAASFLEGRDAVIVDRNVRVGREEIDLIIEHNGRRVAVEVKTGVSGSARPEENFDDAKERHVRNAANRLDIQRVDLVTVLLTATGASVRWLPDVG